jgi:hypothetical protein
MMLGCGSEGHGHPVTADLTASETSLSAALAGLKECEWTALETFITNPGPFPLAIVPDWVDLRVRVNDPQRTVGRDSRPDPT